MDQNWFEMPEVRRRKLANAVWIPLRASHRIEKKGRYGYAGFKEEFYGVGTLTVPIENRREAEKLGWMNIGLSHQHSGGFEDGKYVPADIYQHYNWKFPGLHLVLDQFLNSAEHPEWHLNQDFVITLGLKQETNIWVRPKENYIEVARISKRKDGTPYLLEVRASHLRDYLCARGMALYVTSYRKRVEILEDASNISWPENSAKEINNNDRWEGRVSEIHKGGMRYGAQAFVTHVARTDVDPEEDVPVLGQPTDENIASESWTKEHTGVKLYRVAGELWRTEWVEPASKSPIVRGDEMSSTTFFITDAEGNTESRKTLVAEGRWLWFKPEVMPVLAHRRGGSLSWYTRETGEIACSPGYGVHFGVNSLALINVYAKDIALLPEWQQKIWSGYNVSPEGKVSAELLASQVDAIPANTQAPEEFLANGLELLNSLAETKLGITLIRQHKEIPHFLIRAHRFRATDKEGLFALAKDLTRLTAERIDTAELQKIIAPPKGEKWGSLKSLEKLLATKITPDLARTIMGPLFGIYELRKTDAHLPSQELSEAFGLVDVDQSAPYVTQGYQLLCAFVSCIYSICRVLEGWLDEENELEDKKL